MGMNETPSAGRLHIGFFGCRNAGKSSLVNRVTAQELSVVSSTPGTTTDPVIKSMELLPLGPVVIIDTPGFDDVGALGEKRIKKTREILGKTDIAVLVADGTRGLTETDKLLCDMFREKEIPFIIAANKCDIGTARVEGAIPVSAKTGKNIKELIEKIGSIDIGEAPPRIVGDLVREGDFAVLVTPIDESAPKGRIILPQQQTIRDILDSGAMPIATKPEQLQNVLSGLIKPPRIVICDSQVFEETAKIVPHYVPLTSFSILMARHKGFLKEAVLGASAIDKLRDGDTILISEGCTHHRQCNDIGTVKIPGWIRERVGKDIKFETTSGGSFPDDLSPYSVIVHCGGCMLPARQVLGRMRAATGAKVPFTNYGVLIAHMKGILKRSISCFDDIKDLI